MSISLPQSDVKFLREMARRMGWSLKKQKNKTAFQLSMEQAERGEYTEYSSVDDFKNKVLGPENV